MKTIHINPTPVASYCCASTLDVDTHADALAVLWVLANVTPQEYAIYYNAEAGSAASAENWTSNTEMRGADKPSEDAIISKWEKHFTPKRYYLVSITEVFGEYETQERIIVDNDDERNLMRIAARWRGTVDSTASDAEIKAAYSEEVSGFWFGGFDGAVKIPQIDREISVEERLSYTAVLYEAPSYEPDEER